MLGTCTTLNLVNMLPKLLEMLNSKSVVLASGSPRRLEMLKKVGLNVKLVPSNFEEDLKPSDFKTFSEFVEATALGKVNEVDERLTKEGNPPDLVIGADTMVTLNDTMYGKPKDAEEAFKTLKILSGKPHVVYTGVVLKMGPKIISFTENTKVFIGNLTDEEIQAYVDTKEPLDKAGAYGIQGIGGIIVEKIEGDFFTVMGLPLYRLNKELTKLLLL